MLPIVAQPLIRLSRGRRGVQCAVLTTVSSLAQLAPHCLRPHVAEFFVMDVDPSYVRELKLDILVRLACESNISIILSELQAYVHDANKAFVSQVIVSIGRCAVSMPSVADSCLRTLLRLVSSPSEAVSAQSIVTLRQLLLQKSVRPHRRLIDTMSAMLGRVRVPLARAALVWIVGEYREYIPKRAPDCLRKLAKTFSDEDNIVKLQILTLSCKLFLSNAKQTALLFKYIVDLCKYDVDFDLRDRARMVRALFFKRRDEQQNQHNDAKDGAEFLHHSKDATS